MKRVALIAILMILSILVLSGCQLYTYNYQDNVLEYAMITDSSDLSKLDEFPNLEYVDLRGSSCYEAIIAYAEEHPDVTVRYNISVGEARLDAAATDATLNGYDIDFAMMLDNLQYLPNLNGVHINQLTFTREQMEQLIIKYPSISFTYTVELCGRHYDNSVQDLDLAHLTTEDIDEAIIAITLLPELRQVNLITQIIDGKLPVNDVVFLSEACPAVIFNYEFDLFGQHISTLDEELHFDSVNIGNEGIEQLRRALTIMKQCHSVKLDSCGIDNELLHQLRSEFPDRNIAWRIFAGRFSMMTDEQMVRMNYSLTDKQAEVLKYCTKVKFMDLSNSPITHIDFASNMQDLECVVLSNTRVGDISPLSNCLNLIWLELHNCAYVRDLSAISNLNSLKYLNISGTRVNTLSALDDLSLERLSCVKSSTKDYDIKRYAEMHPDCIITSAGSALTYGWRYNDKNLTELCPYYAYIQDIFRYNDKAFKGNTK